MQSSSIVGCISWYAGLPPLRYRADLPLIECVEKHGKDKVDDSQRVFENLSTGRVRLIYVIYLRRSQNNI
jgi:hypothetical protein